MAWSDLDDRPSLIRPFLQERGLFLKKRWGQNFMIRRADREEVVRLAEIETGDAVWEIGSGLGGITELILARTRDLTVFEVDYGLARVIEERFGNGVRLVLGDAVATMANEAVPNVVVGNLPYRSAAAMLSALLEREDVLSKVRRMVFTVQKEMAQRMAAAPGTKAYSAFTVLCRLAGAVDLRRDISKASFFPAPDVLSSVIVLEPDPRNAGLLPLASLAARSLFLSRRKTINNNAAGLAERSRLSESSVRAGIERAGVDVAARAEELPPESFLRIAESLRGAYEAP